MAFIAFNPKPEVVEEEEGGLVPLSSNTQDRLDLDEGPIRNHNEQGTFDASTYGPGGLENPDNVELYESIGEPGMIPGTRQQRTTNDQGEPRTFFVEPPGQPTGFLGGVNRTVTGGLIEAAAGTAGFGEWLLDKAQQQKDNPHLAPLGASVHELAKFADGLLNTKFSDEDNNWFQQEFPRVAPQNDLEKMGQEITAAVVGGVLGSKKELFEKAGQLGRFTWEAAENFFKKAKEIDYANAGRKTEVFVQELLTEAVGSATGSTITTANDSDSLSGGMVPDVPGLSEHENERLAHLIDNSVLGSIFHLVGKGVSATGRAVAREGLGVTTPAGPMAKRTAVNVLMDIDPHLKDPNLSDEEFARRARLFSEMIKVNDEGNIGDTFGGAVKRDSVTATVVGADKYVEEAYGYMKRSMTAEQWELFKKETASSIANGINTMRRVNMSNPAVQAADAVMNERVEGAFEQAATGLGGPKTPDIGDRPGATKAGQVLGGEVLDTLNSASDVAGVPGATDAIAQGQLDTAMRESAILSAIQQAKDTNSLGDTIAQRQALQRLAGPELLDTYQRSFERYNQLFDAIPDGIPVDSVAIVEALQQAGDRINIRDLVNATGIEGNLVNPINDDEVFQQLVQQWDQVDLKTVFNEIRPQLTKIISDGSGKGTVGVDTTGIQDLKRVIDELVEASNEPAFREALTAYKDHMAAFGSVDSLLNYDQLASDFVQKSATSGGNPAKVYQASVNALNTALKGGDASDEELRAWIGALQHLNPNAERVNAELADIILGTAIAQIGRGRGETTASEVINAVSPYLPALHEVAPESVKVFQGLVDDLQAAKMGSAQAETALKAAQAQATTIMTEAKKRAAHKFLSDTATGMQIGGRGDISRAFINIFGDPTSARDLMAQATTNGDQMVIDGIRAQYLDFLRGKFFGNRPISLTGTGGATMEVSGAALNNFLNGADRSAMEVAQTVLDPKQFDDLNMALNELNISYLSRATRPQTWNSMTQVDTSRRRVFNTLITATLGVLNRTATMVRNVTGNFLNVSEAQQKADIEQIIGGFLTDPDLLTRALDELGPNPTQTKLEEVANFMAGVASGVGVNNSTARATIQAVDNEPEDRTEDALGKPQFAPPR